MRPYVAQRAQHLVSRSARDFLGAAGLVITDMRRSGHGVVAGFLSGLRRSRARVSGDAGAGHERPRCRNSPEAVRDPGASNHVVCRRRGLVRRRDSKRGRHEASSSRRQGCRMRTHARGAALQIGPYETLLWTQGNAPSIVGSGDFYNEGKGIPEPLLLVRHAGHVVPWTTSAALRSP
jgi:hypothetical protein